MSTLMVPSLKRVLLLVRMHMRGNTVVLLVICAALSAFALGPIKSGGNIWRGVLSPSWSLFFTVAGLYWGATIFTALRNPGLRLRYLTLPASAAEKLSAALLAAGLAYLMTVFVPLLASSGVAFVLNAGFWSFPEAIFNPFSPEILSAAWGGTSWVILGMCAGLWVPRWPFLVAVCVLLVFCVLYLGWYMFIFQGTPLAKYTPNTDFSESLIESSRAYQILLGSGYTSNALWSLLPLAALYFRFKESDA